MMKLDIQQSWWAMSGLGNGVREWTIEEKFEKLAEAGFSGILGRLPAQQEAEKWHRLLEHYSFSFGVHAFPFPVYGDDVTVFLQQAKDFGVDYVNAQVVGQFVVGSQAVGFLQSLMQQADMVGMPLFIETHRGRITHDILRTVDYVEALPDLRLSIDFSHYVVGSAMDAGTASEEMDLLLHKLLERTSSIHARVASGNQVQIDIGEAGEHPAVERFLSWWRFGMEQWRAHAADGDRFPFVCELGPPSYSIVDGATGRELSDRWKQALVLKRLAEQAWRG
jgi:hypothetical protein